MTGQVRALLAVVLCVRVPCGTQWYGLDRRWALGFADLPYWVLVHLSVLRLFVVHRGACTDGC